MCSSGVTTGDLFKEIIIQIDQGEQGEVADLFFPCSMSGWNDKKKCEVHRKKKLMGKKIEAEKKEVRELGRK